MHDYDDTDIFNGFPPADRPDGANSISPEFTANYQMFSMLTLIQQQVLQNNMEMQKLRKKFKKKQKKSKTKKNKRMKKYWRVEDIMAQQQQQLMMQGYYGQPQQPYRGRWDKTIENSVPQIINLASKAFDRKTASK